MATPQRNPFTTIRTEGALLPADFLQQLVERQSGIPGVTAEAYHLSGEKLNEAASRAWNRLVGAWAAFQGAVAKQSTGEAATGVTREKWLLPLFQELGYGRLTPAKGFEIDGKSYPISHVWGNSPIHLLGTGVELDRPSAGVPGAARRSPHSLVQEFLNRSDAHLWAFLSNGSRLRILRDNKSLTRQAYVEFDLVALMDGQVYSDFFVLWLLCHQSRVEGERPEECWLEKWTESALERGTRALDQLRDGVARAIEHLGAGFLSHPANAALLERLRSGEQGKQDYYRQLLRMVYRLIFLLVAEDRDVLLTAASGSPQRRRYERHYSLRRLRDLAQARRGSAHVDLWEGVKLVLGWLRADTGCAALGLPRLGSLLWSERATPDLDDCLLSNAALLEAVRALAFTVEKSVRRAIDYRSLGPEELGSVYEALLELHPVIEVDAGRFALDTAVGHERKTTGSYYTPSSLIASLLDTALEPVLDEAVAKPEPENALLALKVCDPAVGSGHFLIAAAHRIAKRLATVRTGDEEPSPEALRTALRDVIGHCLYGVDANPMAVELCKVNLWLEALEPGKPLSFLDHHIQLGNSLLGATPALLDAGIPDDAFKPVEGDDATFCREYKKKNKSERTGQTSLFQPTQELWQQLAELREATRSVEALGDGTPEAIARKEREWEELLGSHSYEAARLRADSWCAAFLWEKRDDPERPYPMTEETYRKVAQDPRSVPRWLRAEVARLAGEYRLIHWHLAFPNVFRSGPEGEEGSEATGWAGGFDVVLGNPPWERVKLQEKEFFAERDPEIAMASSAATRRRLIKSLPERRPELHSAFLRAKRASEAVSHFIRSSGRYPLCGRGDVNTYALFAELNYGLQSPAGRVGCLLPSGIATDDTTKHFFQEVVDSGAIRSLFDFENRRRLFPGVHGSYRFCLLTLSGRSEAAADFFFYAHRVEDLQDATRRFTLKPADLALLNPISRTCPIFRTRRDAELAERIYRQVPVLGHSDAPGSGWSARLLRIFDMTNDSSLFRVAADLEADGFVVRGHSYARGSSVWLPVYEGKMVGMYDHRASHIEINRDNPQRQQQTRPLTAEEHQDPTALPTPYLWGPAEVAAERSPQLPRWFPTLKRVTAATNERTLLGAIVPWCCLSYTLYGLTASEVPPRLLAALFANSQSFIADYLVRQKTSQPSLPIGPILETPFLPPGTYSAAAPWDPGVPLVDWLLPRVLELSYTSFDLVTFASDLGWDGPPFRWDPPRRHHLRCELDAAFFMLYGLSRNEIEHVLDSFTTVRQRDVSAHGDYRTKLLILDAWARMKEAVDAGERFVSLQLPPPADPSCAHPESSRPGWATLGQ